MLMQAALSPSAPTQRLAVKADMRTRPIRMPTLGPSAVLATERHPQQPQQPQQQQQQQQQQLVAGAGT